MALLLGGFDREHVLRTRMRLNQVYVLMDEGQEERGQTCV